eukprot:NODE_90_length_2508_cov_177.579911_g71_i0.p1 GENE.NODE_90_length_2508_cov_177.579911_g71_i0~~NODE_90_length_2508_cov_177.579911_g71_i0.p1  ORF type:complete len:768 (-),score=203.08 NODE_90_length_2508_cov_177.579911_g71_i0:118-2421(-)
MKDLRPLVGNGSTRVKRLVRQTDAASVATLKSDMLLLQQRIDLLMVEQIPLSQSMQQQERLLSSIPDELSEAETAATKLKLFEAVLSKIRELSISLLRVGKKPTTSSALLPFDSNNRSSPPAALSTGNTQLDAVPTTPLVHPLGQPSPVGRLSFVDAFVGLADAVSAASIEDYVSAAEKMNLEEERTAYFERLQAAATANAQKLLQDERKEAEQLQRKTQRRVEELTQQLEDMKTGGQGAGSPGGGGSSKDGKSKTSAPAKDLSKEVHQLSDEKHRLTEELDSVREDLKAYQAYCAQAKEIGFAGLGSTKFLPELGLDISFPPLPEPSNASETSPRQTPVPNAPSRRFSKDTPTTGGGGGGKGNKKGKDDQLEHMFQQQVMQIDGLSAAIVYQNKILQQLKEQLPEEIRRRDREIAAARAEAQRLQQRHNAAVSEKEAIAARHKKNLRDKDAEIQSLTAEVMTYKDAQRSALEEVAADERSAKILPVVRSAGFTPPINMVQKLKGQNHVLTKMEKQMQSLNTNASSVSQQLKERDQELEGLKLEVSRMRSIIASLRKQVDNLTQELTEKSADFEHKELLLRTTTDRLSKTTEHSQSVFERSKRVELQLTKVTAALDEQQREAEELRNQLAEVEERRKEALQSFKVSHAVEVQRLNDLIAEANRETAATEQKVQQLVGANKDLRLQHAETLDSAQNVFALDRDLLEAQSAVLNPPVSVDWNEVRHRLTTLEEQTNAVVQTVDDSWKIHLRSVESNRIFLCSLMPGAET